MGFPVALAVWGGRALYAAYRARQAAQVAGTIARTQAPAAATAGALVGGGAVVTEMATGDDAADDANATSGATPIAGAEACSTCEPPGCGPLNNEIRDLRDQLENRHRDMLIDRYDLFNRAFSRNNPFYIDGRRIGSWEGHVDQFEQKQTRLRRLVADARELGCSINTHDADRWGSIDPPSRPSPSFD